MELADLSEDIPGHNSPLSFLDSSPFSLSPSTEPLFSARFHPAPDHITINQPLHPSQQPTLPTINENLQQVSQFTPTPSLDLPKTASTSSSTSTSNFDWTRAKLNKPVGIAFPRKIETKEELGDDFCTDMGGNELECLKESDEKPPKTRTVSSSSSSGSLESCRMETKPYVDSGFGENSCTDVASSVDGHVGTASTLEEGSSDEEPDSKVTQQCLTLEPPPSVRSVHSVEMKGACGREYAVEVPRNKRCHVFVSHSTSDRAWAEQSVAGRMSKSFKVLISAAFMDRDRYRDHDILAYMPAACAIVIGLSPAYLRSPRCEKEWKHAVDLAERHGVILVVALVIQCSRPLPLKKFLYLDFVSKSKIAKVWEVLQDRIWNGVKHFQNLTTPTTVPTPSPGTAGPSHQQTVYRSPHLQDSSYLEHYQQQQPPNHNNSHHQNYHQAPQQQNSFEHEKETMPIFSSQDSIYSYNRDMAEEQNMQLMEEFDKMYQESRVNYEATCQSGSCNDSEDPHEGTGTPNSGMFPDSEIEAADGNFNEDHLVGSFDLSTPGFDTKLVTMLGESEEGLEEEGEKEEGGMDAETFGMNWRKRRSDSLEDEGEDRKRGGFALKRPRIDREEGDTIAAVGTIGSVVKGLKRPADSEVADGDVAGKGKRPRLSHGSSGDVEEGELSDYSDELKNEGLKTPDAEESTFPEPQEQMSRDITRFYNNLAKPEVDNRDESPIKLLRNFNNWTKSIVLRTYLAQCVRNCTALDLCCGKGGDLLKWKEGRIRHLVCADISGDSIEAAKQRYNSYKMKGNNKQLPFTADFYTMDCTKERLIEEKNRCHFNIASCQFSLHYSFETYEKAHRMLQNACESLRPGAFFVGTTVDADQLVHRLRKQGVNEEGVWSIGNKVFSVTLDPSLDISNLPLFGARYNFKLHDVVDLPEYLIHFPLLQKMLEEFDMELVRKQNFYHFFKEHRDIVDDKSLLFRMSAFSKDKGTMSQDEWDVIGLYLVFVFQKRKRNHSEHY